MRAEKKAFNMELKQSLVILKAVDSTDLSRIKWKPDSKGLRNRTANRDYSFKRFDSKKERRK